MKRAPKPGELALRHSTEETGDVQTFAICPSNYGPATLAQMAGMERTPLLGYTLYVVERAEGRVSFRVLRANGDALTANEAVRSGGVVDLRTSILQPMPPDEAAMLADLEQCAALMLLMLLEANP